MESLAAQLSLFTEQAIGFIWFPLAIWTAVSIAAWVILRSSRNLHPQLHYHGRLALLFALPAGLLFLALLQGIGTLVMPETTTESTLKIVTFASPIEMGVTQAESSSSFSYTELAYLGVALVFFAGIVVLTLRFLMQWIQLQRLKRTVAFMPIERFGILDLSNRKLAASNSKQIRVAFLRDAIVPVTFGIRNPVILLPNTIQHDGEKCNLAIRHELTHITQRDFLTHAMVLATQVLFWFHPFVHLFKRELVDYREMRCDSMVLSGKNVSRKRYASLLLELLPMPTINKELSVHMAQESSNLKKRIQMITQQNLNRPIPKRLSITIFTVLVMSIAVAMACTDMQTHEVFDSEEEELDLMVHTDLTGDRGYHQVLIFMGHEGQAERHENAIELLQTTLMPEHIMSIEILKGDDAIERHGQRASNGVVQVNIRPDAESYNRTLRALGMEPQDLAGIENDDAQEEYFVVVEDMPELIGGLQQLQRQIRYPEMARRAGIEGRVFVQFIVNDQGEVESPQVIRGIGGGADEEALRVVSQASFRPGMQRGRPVRVQYSLPIFFRLAGSETTGGEAPPSEDDDLVVVGYGNPAVNVEDPEVVEQSMTVELERSGNQLLGTVLDTETGQPLAGANIILEGTTNGTTTDMDGKFTINGVRPNDAQINISYVGYGRTEVAF